MHGYRFLRRILSVFFIFSIGLLHPGPLSANSSVDHSFISAKKMLIPSAQRTVENGSGLSKYLPLDLSESKFNADTILKIKTLEFKKEAPGILSAILPDVASKLLLAESSFEQEQKSTDPIQQNVER